jgi:hypothetical protein
MWLSNVKELQDPLVAAVAVVEKQPPVTARRVERLQNREIGEMDELFGIGRRLVEIGDAALRRSVGIDGEMGAPREPLIGTDGAELRGLGEGKRRLIGSSRLVILPPLSSAHAMIGKDKVRLNPDGAMLCAADKREPFGRSPWSGRSERRRISGFLERNFRRTRRVRCGNAPLDRRG